MCLCSREKFEIMQVGSVGGGGALYVESAHG